MQIIQKVIVKQMITENSKYTLQKKFEREKKQLELECQQLLFEQRKLMNKLTQSKTEVEERFEREINFRKDKMLMIDFKIEQLEVLEIGSEIIEREMEAIVPVEVGKDWETIMKERIIVVKDNIIVRIDE
ncbi:MAG TPA: YlqD family protein [Candidatus Pseudogracilibacillus intestinigallinarum]|uniref:YlqD family protein n=1 Tax=Candidatus Pseudogracilibacillus intestinigallinarum TaxID=2838742 RepID=A0A9D1TLX4_9BACI|nr:YlqD family protein [Candidatus Pseudogracilibacillus intestinigallinarum]